MIFLLFPLFLVFCYFLWQKWELTKFQVTEYQVSSPKLTFPANVAVIADLHGFSYGKGNERLLRQVRALSPQAILIPGDMLVSKYPATYAAALSTLRGLAEIAPVYYSFGNHESRLRDPETMNHPLFLQYQKEAPWHTPGYGQAGFEIIPDAPISGASPYSRAPAGSACLFDNSLTPVPAQKASPGCRPGRFPGSLSPGW